MSTPDNSPGNAWSGMALMAALQVAAGELECDERRSSESVLRSICDVVLTIDWTAVPLLEFVVARSVVVRFICEAAARYQFGLIPTDIVARLAAVSADGFGETAVDALRRVRACRQMQYQGSSDERVRTALQLIQLNCGRRVRVDELAAAVGLSRWHLERLTKKHTGTSPRQHLIAARMERAVALLSQRRLSIKELAFRVGYGNANAFTRDFRKWYGAPPRTWLRSLDR